MAFDVHNSHRTFIAVAGGLYLVLVVLVAILPAAEIQRLYPPEEDAWEDERVARGRLLYKRYNCVTCHTMQIRGDERLAKVGEDGVERVPVVVADRRFGLDRPTTAEEYRNDDPPFLGTQRTGPDLTAVGTRLPSATWHYWHLYQPRSVSPDSIMQGLPWLFRLEGEHDPQTDEKVAPLYALDVPKNRIWATPDAQALVEFLLSRTRRESTR